MTILKRARRLAETGRQWFVPAPGPVAWGRLYNCGILVALNPDADPDAVGLTLARSGEHEHELPVTRRFAEGGTTYLHAALDPVLLAAPATLRFTVTEPGRADQQRVATGPGHHTLHLDGVVGGVLSGWVSSLSTDPLPSVHLVIDGVEGEPVRPGIYRPELRFGGREGGWNGFRFVLPAWALDGQPHTVAVRAGDTLEILGSYAPRLRSSLHVEAPSRVTGWVFERGRTRPAEPGAGGPRRRGGGAGRDPSAGRPARAVRPALRRLRLPARDAQARHRHRGRPDRRGRGDRPPARHDRARPGRGAGAAAAERARDHAPGAPRGARPSGGGGPARRRGAPRPRRAGRAGSLAGDRPHAAAGLRDRAGL